MAIFNSYVKLPWNHLVSSNGITGICQVTEQAVTGVCSSQGDSMNLRIFMVMSYYTIYSNLND